MGAKTQAIVKQKRPPLSCGDCREAFTTSRALKSHILTKHTTGSKQSKNLDGKDEKKTAFVPPTSRVSRRLQQKKSVDKEISFGDRTQSDRRVVFECPHCIRVFSVYFSALKHIERRHGADGNGENSQSKPIHIEMCTLCDVQIKGGEHSCDYLSTEKPKPKSIKSKSKTDGGMYSCLGCEIKYTSVAKFDQHVSEDHCEDVDILVFKHFNAFLRWKNDMETQVQIKYLSLSNTSNRQYYQCNYVSLKNSANVTHLCPSILITRNLPKGVVEVQFYKKHYNHVCPPYKVPKKYKASIVNQNLATGDVIFDRMLKYDNNDLYIKFSNVLKNIIIGAARINITNLKKLYRVALDMQTRLMSYDEDQEDSDTALQMQAYLNSLHKDEKESINSDTDDQSEITVPKNNEALLDSEANTSVKSITDAQISNILEEPRSSARLKRKSESSPATITKVQKVETHKEDNEATTGLKEKENNSITKDIIYSSPKIMKPPSNNQSPSFNDSYKQFIDNTLLGNEITIPKAPRRSVVRKEIVKTKIGQFIPSPKKQTQAIDLFKNVESKELVTPPQTSVVDLNLEEVEYEVVEQENDCNILVLKI